MKAAFLPSGGRPFTAANISYTTLDVSKSDGGVHPFKAGWKSGPTALVVVADRAVGDGNDPATRSSVWTEAGSGAWKGWAALHDGSTVRTFNPGTARTAPPPSTASPTPPAAAATSSAAAEADRQPARDLPGSGLLCDEADFGTDPKAF